MWSMHFFPGSKLTGWSKARQQMLKLWGLSWLTPNHHSGFYVVYPLTLSTKARPRQWGRDRGEAEAVFLRQRQANEAETSKCSASRQPWGEAAASRTSSLSMLTNVLPVDLHACWLFDHFLTTGAGSCHEAEASKCSAARQPGGEASASRTSSLVDITSSLFIVIAALILSLPRPPIDL